MTSHHRLYDTETIATDAAGRAEAPGTDAPVRAAQRRRGARFPRGLRRLVVTAHIASSVGWLGLSIGYLTLGVTGLVTGDPDTQHAVYLALGVLVPYAVAPISLLALGTGIAIALGGGWGLLRHWWVTIKLAITAITATLTWLLLRPGALEMAETMRAAPDGELISDAAGAFDLLAAGCVSFTLYLFMLVLSVYKPFGRLRGRR